MEISLWGPVWPPGCPEGSTAGRCAVTTGGTDAAAPGLGKPGVSEQPGTEPRDPDLSALVAMTLDTHRKVSWVRMETAHLSSSPSFFLLGWGEDTFALDIVVGKKSNQAP